MASALSRSVLSGTQREKCSLNSVPICLAPNNSSGLTNTILYFLKALSMGSVRIRT